MEKVNLAAKLDMFENHWCPRIVASHNDNDIMVVKFRGEFPFQKHPNTDDFFLVLEGEACLDVLDKILTLRPGKMFVVPKGVVHRPRSVNEANVLLIEPKGTPNTGDVATAARKPKI